jgi:ATP-dependent RNA helicase DeaD
MTEKTQDQISDGASEAMTDQSQPNLGGDPASPGFASPLDRPLDGGATDAPPKPKGPSFAELGVRPEVLRAIEEMGFTEPMMVQAKTLPLILEGRDLMVQSRTGSGKTAAFGIPFASGIVSADEKFVQALVLLPTRELALQVAAELARIAAHSGIVVVPVYGGAPMGRQVEMLAAGGQIVCGTPGRVLDHMRRGTLRLERVKCAVLDECDEMLSMGFQEDIEAILEKTPETRQTLLFSATVPEGIQRLSRRFLRNPEFLKLSADFVGVHEIKHLYYAIPGVNRENELLRILTFEDPKSAIIFCNTREETSRIAEFLRQKGHDAEAISSDLSQSDRERVMARMRAGGIKFLVATDVAARGIDIENLSYVFNYTFPEAPEIYIHRTGRTGRAGKQGTAVSLIGPTEVGSFYYLKLLYKIRPEERALPSEVEIRSRREGERVLALRAALIDDPGVEWRGLARRLMSAIDGERVIASLLARSFAKEEGMPAAPKAAPVAIAAACAARSASAAPRERDREPERDRERATFGGAPARGAPSRGRGGFDRPRGERGERGSERPERGDRATTSDRGERPTTTDRPERATTGERGERPARSEHRRPDRAPRGDSPSPSASPSASAPTSTSTSTAPSTASRGAAGQAPEREFWEVWSEERESSTAAPDATGSELTEASHLVDASRPPETGATFARLYLNLGRKDGANEEQVRDLIANHAGPIAVEGMDIMNTHTYVNVAPGDADRLCAALVGKEVAGREIICERAKPRRS